VDITHAVTGLPERAGRVAWGLLAGALAVGALAATTIIELGF